jgi:hypothetical protein
VDPLLRPRLTERTGSLDYATLALGRRGNRAAAARNEGDTHGGKARVRTRRRFNCDDQLYSAPSVSMHGMQSVRTMRTSLHGSARNVEQSWQRCSRGAWPGARLTAGDSLQRRGSSPHAKASYSRQAWAASRSKSGPRFHLSATSCRACAIHRPNRRNPGFVRNWSPLASSNPWRAEKPSGRSHARSPRRLLHLGQHH